MSRYGNYPPPILQTFSDGSKQCIRDYEPHPYSVDLHEEGNYKQMGKKQYPFKQRKVTLHELLYPSGTCIKRLDYLFL